MILLDWDLKRMTCSMKRKDKFLINNSIFIGGGGGITNASINLTWITDRMIWSRLVSLWRFSGNEDSELIIKLTALWTVT